jgi:hypothetical protein
MESWGGKGKGGAVALWRASEGMDLCARSEGVPGRVGVGVTCPWRERERRRGVVDISKDGCSILAPGAFGEFVNVGENNLEILIRAFLCYSHNDWWDALRVLTQVTFTVNLFNIVTLLLSITTLCSHSASDKNHSLEQPMANSPRLHEPSGVNGPPIGPISQSQNSVLKWSLLRLRATSLTSAIVSVVWLVAFIILIRALAGVGYVRTPLEEAMGYDHLITADTFAPHLPDSP